MSGPAANAQPWYRCWLRSSEVGVGHCSTIRTRDRVCAQPGAAALPATLTKALHEHPRTNREEILLEHPAIDAAPHEMAGRSKAEGPCRHRPIVIGDGLDVHPDMRIDELGLRDDSAGLDHAAEIPDEPVVGARTVMCAGTRSERHKAGCPGKRAEMLTRHRRHGEFDTGSCGFDGPGTSTVASRKTRRRKTSGCTGGPDGVIVGASFLSHATNTTSLR